VTARRLTLEELHRLAVSTIGTEWTTTYALGRRLGIGASGMNNYRLALVLERAAADGYLELRRAGTRRYFRFFTPEPHG
jgi:hypothetical protein